MLQGIRLLTIIIAGYLTLYKAKNAEHQGLRFSISFPQMRNELCCKISNIFATYKIITKKSTFKFIYSLSGTLKVAPIITRIRLQPQAFYNRTIYILTSYFYLFHKAVTKLFFAFLVLAITLKSSDELSNAPSKSNMTSFFVSVAFLFSEIEIDN